MCDNKCKPQCICVTKTKIISDAAGRDGLNAMQIDQMLGLFPQDGTYDEWRLFWQKEAIDGIDVDVEEAYRRLDVLEGKVSLQQSAIEQNATDITLRVTQENFDLLGVRVGTAETSINSNALAITLKADQTDLDDVGDRVTANEASLIVQAGEIASKVSQADFNTLNNTVTLQGTQIVQNANSIALKADQADFNTLEGTVTSQGTQITQNATDITSKASQSSVDALGNRVTTAESSITQNASEIALRVTQGEIESNFSMTANKMKLFSKEIEMSGIVTFQGTAAQTKADAADTKATNAQTTAETASNQIDAWKYPNKTTINGGVIETNSITADKIDVNLLTAKTIQTAKTGERFTVGFIPSDPSDPTSDPTKFSRHGVRQYHDSGKIALYDGVVRNFEYQKGSTTRVLNEYARVVFKDEDNSPVLYVLDSSSTGGIQYITFTPDSYSKHPMKFITGGELTGASISNAFLNPNTTCGRFSQTGTSPSMTTQAELRLSRSHLYYLFVAGTGSSDSNKIVVDESSGGDANAIPDGWYLTGTMPIDTLLVTTGLVRQKYTWNFTKYIGGEFAGWVDKYVIVEMDIDMFSIMSENTSEGIGIQRSYYDCNASSNDFLTTLDYDGIN